jgi:hypothetical protein
MNRHDLMRAFLKEMYRYSPLEARVMACAFRGDPNQDMKGKWRAFPITRTEQLDDEANVYLAVSAMKRNAAGEYRRRKENFDGGLLLMIDDIGTGPGSKFPTNLLDAATPTALIETSPDNHQAVYMFRELITDPREFDALINGFITKKFLGHDTGMAGINRVFRPPWGVNGKIKYNGWKVKAVAWNPEKRYSLRSLAKAFGIDVDSHLSGRTAHNATVGKAESIRAFVAVRQALREAGMVKREEPDVSGWLNVYCPWTDGHTDRADNGAAIREPAEENGWGGGFKCFHGSCAGRGWKDLTEWLSENQEEVLAAANANNPKFSDFQENGK